MCNDCEVDYEHVDIAREDFEQAQYFKSSSRIIPLTIDSKAELLQEGIFFPHSFIRDVLVMKKLEIEKTKPTFIISVLKVEYYVVLVSSISNFLSSPI